MAKRKKPIRLVPQRYRFGPWYYQITGEPPPGPATVLPWRSQAEAAPDHSGDVVLPLDDADNGDVAD
jgi:hypothetical protein